MEARTDGADTETHGGGVLDGKVTESSAGTGEDDPVADDGVGVLDGAVDGDTGAEDGGGLSRVDAVGDGGDVADVGLDVLGEGAVDGEAGVLALQAD